MNQLQSRGERQAVITRHAIERFLERVAPATPVGVAARTMEHIFRTATVRARPRKWMRMVRVKPGSRYMYSADHPDVCLVAVGDVIVTVYSRAECARWRRRQLPERIGDHPPRRRMEPARRWTFELGEAA